MDSGIYIFLNSYAKIKLHTKNLEASLPVHEGLGGVVEGGVQGQASGGAGGAPQGVAEEGGQEDESIYHPWSS